MFLLLILWLYISFFCIVIGAGTLRLFTLFFRPENTRLPSWELVWICGLGSLSVVLYWISIFLPVSLTVHLFLLACTLMIFIRCYGTVREIFAEMRSSFSTFPAMIKVMMLLMLVFVLEKTSLPPLVFDAGLYHLQTMNWIETFRVIPGLGNLHDRLAFNSGWFISSTFFRLTGLYPNGFYPLNGLLFVIATFTGLRGLSAVFSGAIRLKWSISLLFLFSFLLFIKQLSSPSPDMPVTVLIWMVFFVYMARENSEREIAFADIICLLLPVIIISFKFSALPVFLLPAYMLVRYLRTGKTRFAGKILLLMTLIMLPWMIRSVILSGYLLFPNTSIDLFTFDWKIPAETARQTAAGIIAWGRLPGADHAVVLQMRFVEWFPIWFSGLFVLDKVLLILFVSSFMAWITRMLLRFPAVRAYFTSKRRHLVILAVSLGGLGFWMCTAPDFRFAYAFLLMAVLILIYPLIKLLFEHPNIRNRVPLVIAGGVLVFQLLVFMLYSFYIIRDQPIAHRLLMPSAPQVPSLENRRLLFETREGYAKSTYFIDVFLPLNTTQCGNAPLPCSFYLDPHLKMRGNKMEDGFKIQAE